MTTLAPDNELKANYFVTVIDGKMTGATYAFPPQELRDNQFEITYREYKLLQSTSPLSLADLKEMIESLEKRIDEVSK